LQTMIRKMFEVATSTIRIEGTEIIPIPLYEVLDGTHTQDYTQRVEPSASGGRKMAELILRKVASHSSRSSKDNESTIPLKYGASAKTEAFHR